MLPQDNPIVEQRAFSRSNLPSRLSRGFDMGASGFVFSKYGGGAATGLAEVMAGGSATTALATTAGFTASQAAFDVTAPLFRGVGTSMQRMGAQVGAAAPNISRASRAGRMAHAGVRGAGGMMRGAGMAMRGVPYLGVAAVVGLMFPDKHPVRQAADYLTGVKFGDWMQERTNQIKLEKKGGFGVSSSVMNNERVMNARNIAKTLIGQSASVNMLGQEASFMHN